ncbi:MAG TPA: porin [Burkholderiaceae bacterium]|jgi:predicted porin
MKKKKSVLAVSIGLSCLAAHADEGVTIYGVADAFVQVLDGSANISRVQSGGLVGSRLGFKGSEDLGGGLKAFFWLESGMSMDDGTISQSGAFFGRQSQVGLSGNFGTVSLGRQYGMLYYATTDMSIFTNAAAGPSTVLIGGFGGGYEPVRGASGTAVPPATGATGNGSPLRVNNSVRYESPSYEGFKFSVLYGAGELAGLTNQARTVDLGVRYTRDGFDVIASLVSDRTAAGSVLDATDAQTRTLAASYRIEGFRVVAGYLDFKDKRPTNASGLDGKGAWVGADYRIGQQLFKIQYIQNKPSSGANNKTQALGAGWVYDLSRRSALYTSLTRYKNDDRAGTAGLGRFNGAVPPGVTVPADNSITEFALGVRHSF